MARFYFRKMVYDNVEVIAMFEHGEIQRPIAILFPDDIQELIKCNGGAKNER